MNDPFLYSQKHQKISVFGGLERKQLVEIGYQKRDQNDYNDINLYLSS